MVEVGCANDHRIYGTHHDFYLILCRSALENEKFKKKVIPKESMCLLEFCMESLECNMKEQFISGKEGCPICALFAVVMLTQRNSDWLSSAFREQPLLAWTLHRIACTTGNSISLQLHQHLILYDHIQNEFTKKYKITLN